MMITIPYNFWMLKSNDVVAHRIKKTNTKQKNVQQSNSMWDNNNQKTSEASNVFDKMRK